MELVYVQCSLDDGSVGAWSSTRGILNTEEVHWRAVFMVPDLAPVEAQARALIHFLGDVEAVPQDERLWILDSAKRAGYGIARIEDGEPALDPEEAFALLLLPFT
ncbi:MAG: hypothetical protein HY751_10020 [Nitrospinae bacterium]|nr:hypothetical protein [Nitrospinota bacterium]